MIFRNLLIGMLFGLVLASAAHAQGKGDKEFGEYLSSLCVTCHQLSGKTDGIPPIIGWPEDTFLAAMLEYRDGKRENPVMRTIAGRLSAEETEALATYFSSIKK